MARATLERGGNKDRKLPSLRNNGARRIGQSFPRDCNHNRNPRFTTKFKRTLELEQSAETNPDRADLSALDPKSIVCCVLNQHQHPSAQQGMPRTHLADVDITRITTKVNKVSYSERKQNHLELARSVVLDCMNSSISAKTPLPNLPNYRLLLSIA
jgi:hypothetical protein